MILIYIVTKYYDWSFFFINLCSYEKKKLDMFVFYRFTKINILSGKDSRWVNIVFGRDFNMNNTVRERSLWRNILLKHFVSDRKTRLLGRIPFSLS